MSLEEKKGEEKKDKKKPKVDFATLVAFFSAFGGDPVQEEEGQEEDLTVSPELRQLAMRLPKIDDEMGANNAEWCYWRDNTAQALTTTITSAIYGDGVKIISENEKVVKVLEKFNRQINEENLGIADMIHQSFEDNVMQGISVWFKKVTKGENGEKTLRVIKTDPKFIEKVRHPTEGWVKFIQKVYTEHEPPASRNAFDSDKYDPIQKPKGTETRDVHLPSKEVVWFDFFRKPPLRCVIHLISFKMQIVTFMKTAAKKFASPIPMAKLGTFEDHNTNIEEYQEELSDAAKALAKSKNFDAMGVPYNWDISIMETANKVMDFRAKLEWLDKQIARALFGSIALFEASGSELATNRTIERVMLRRIDYFRQKFELSFIPLYEEVLLLNDLDGKEFSLEWSPLTEENKVELVNAVVSLKNAGILEDENEARKLLAPLFDLPPIKEPEFEEGAPPEALPFPPGQEEEILPEEKTPEGEPPEEPEGEGGSEIDKLFKGAK